MKRNEEAIPKKAVLILPRSFYLRGPETSLE